MPFSKLKYKFVYVPVNGNSHQSKHTGTYGQHGHELADLAIGCTKRPVAGEHVTEVHGYVKCGHHSVRYGQIDQEIVSHVTHPFVSHHDPYDNQVATRGHHNHRHKKCGPR